MDDTGPLDFNNKLYRIRRLSDGKFYGKKNRAGSCWVDAGTYLTRRGINAVMKGSFTRDQLEDLEVLEYRVEERYSHSAYRIKRNMVKCLKCGEIIESVHRHDFKWCKCKGIAVDGGTAYLKRCGNLKEYKDMSEMGAFQA